MTSRPAIVRIGITGPIGCGKSTVTGWLAELGAVAIDADRVARDVVAPGSAALEAVLAAFGPAVRAADGSLDRQALGRIVFADEGALGRLEAIVHPAVRSRILAAIEAAEADDAPAVAIEAIKLVEGGLAALCNEVWLVRCEPADQRARLAARGMPRDDVEDRIRAQSGLEARVAPVATRVIDTSGTLASTRRRVLGAWRNAIGG